MSHPSIPERYAAGRQRARHELLGGGPVSVATACACAAILSRLDAVRVMRAEQQGDAGTLLALMLSAAERELIALDDEVTR